MLSVSYYGEDESHPVYYQETFGCRVAARKERIDFNLRPVSLFTELCEPPWSIINTTSIYINNGLKYILI